MPRLVLRWIVVLGWCFVLAACAPAAQPVEQTAAASAGRALALDVVNPERKVQAGSDQTFDFNLVNTKDKPLQVVISLAHSGGKRWRTSLCVGQQCLLGDGSKPTVADPLTLPPYLEQPFQAHVFVDDAARAGDKILLTLQVDGEDAASATVGLRAQVDAP